LDTNAVDQPDDSASDQPDWCDSHFDHEDDWAQVSSSTSSSTTTSTTTRVSVVSPLNDSLSAANPVIVNVPVLNDEHEKILRGNGGDLNKYFIAKYDLKTTSAYYDITDSDKALLAKYPDNHVDANRLVVYTCILIVVFYYTSLL
jgi:hypothetical protein